MGKIIVTRSEFDCQCNESGVSLRYADNTDVLRQETFLRGKKAANRIVYQAMEGCDGELSGAPGELTVRRYMRFSDGAPAIIWFEATAVCREGRANPRQLYITDGNAGAFKDVVDKIKQNTLQKFGFSPLVIMQLTHSGRYSKPDGVPAPLIMRNNPIFEKQPLDKSCVVSDGYLAALPDKFAKAAVLAQRAGFDGVDIKSCHGYLFNEALASFTRQGDYGGSYENRTRLIKDTFKAVKAAVSSDMLIVSRMNAYDGFDYPYSFGAKIGSNEPDFSEIIRLATELKQLGLDLLNITMGNPYVNPHINRPFAAGGYAPDELPIAGVARMLNGTALIKRAVADLPIVCSALTYLGAVAPNVAAGYISEGFDYAGFGRLTLAYPDAAFDIINNRVDNKKLCVACSKCSAIMRAGGTPGCVIRDSLYGGIYKEMVNQGKIQTK